MENKYDKGFWEFEQQYKEQAQLIDSELRKQYSLKISNNDVDNDYIRSICLNFHLYSFQLKEWILKTVFSYFTKETLIACYLIHLTDALMLNDKEKLLLLKSSMKQIGLIKDIKLQHNKIILITKDNQVIKLQNLFNEEKVRNEFNNRCHSGCEFLIRNYTDLSDGASIITIQDRFIDKNPMYHSVILTKNEYIVDPARNMIMKLDDYKKLFNPQIIMCMSREQMINEIETLKEIDEEFNKSELNNVLKLAINTQINRKQLR